MKKETTIDSLVIDKGTVMKGLIKLINATDRDGDHPHILDLDLFEKITTNKARTFEIRPITTSAIRNCLDGKIKIILGDSKLDIPKGIVLYVAPHDCVYVYHNSNKVTMGDPTTINQIIGLVTRGELLRLSMKTNNENIINNYDLVASLAHVTLNMVVNEIKRIAPFFSTSNSTLEQFEIVMLRQIITSYFKQSNITDESRIRFVTKKSFEDYRGTHETITVGFEDGWQVSETLKNMYFSEHKEDIYYAGFVDFFKYISGETKSKYRSKNGDVEYIGDSRSLLFMEVIGKKKIIAGLILTKILNNSRSILGPLSLENPVRTLMMLNDVFFKTQLSSNNQLENFLFRNKRSKAREIIFKFLSSPIKIK